MRLPAGGVRRSHRRDQTVACLGRREATTPPGRTATGATIVARVIGSETLATTGPAADGQGRFARDALRSQRERLVTLLAGFDREAWDAPSRCSEWSVHEVVRHLSDVTLKSTALVQGARTEDVDARDMDPRTAPAGWLGRSEGESPRDTLAALERATTELLEAVDRQVGTATEVHWIYGSVPWSTAVLHVFWDAWIHERDILLPLGEPHDSPPIESRAAAAYGLLMAVLPTLAAGGSLKEVVALSGQGGGSFLIEADGGTGGRPLSLAGLPVEGTVTVKGADDDAAGRVDGALTGTLVEVVDSLVGREPDLTQALHGPPDRVQGLGFLRAFMLTPVV